MTITMTAQEEGELWDEVAQSVVCDAREILHSHLENPPLLVELAQQVGISDACGGLRLRTLRRGFQELFGTTVFRYLTDKRME